MVFGDRRPYLVAVIVPRQEFLDQFTRERRRDGDGVALDAALHKAIAAAVDRVNAALPMAERIRRFVVAREPFSIQNGLMTPTLKIKRHAIRDVYGESLAQLYEAKA